MTITELKDRLTDIITLLAVPGIGRGRYWKLLKSFGSARAVLKAPISRLEVIPGIGRTVASTIKQKADPEQASAMAEEVISLGWEVLFPELPGYPKSLLEIPDKPACLFRRGQPVGDEEKKIAIVGTRHASEEGRLFASRLATELTAAGIVVVSGMAEGIDTAAHAGAIKAGGTTIAVWGTSLETVYPSTNKELAKQIAAHGCIYSEYFPGQGPDKSTFPERNRIISGLSEGVVVIEAGRRSGALITAELALQQGRELFAVPGPPGAERSFGANALIKKGARMVTSVEDIFEELPRLRGEVAARRFKARPEMTAQEQTIIDFLADGPVQIDALSRQAGMSVAEVLEFMLALEMKGVVQELSGKRYILCD